jgi:hypothetical protein
MLWPLAACLALTLIVWVLGAREPVYAIGRRKPAWFVALRCDGAEALDLATDVTLTWRSTADFMFIGDGESYWTEFAILAGGAPDRPPLAIGPGVADAFVARVDLMRPPVLALGALKLLVFAGLLPRPRGATLTDARTLGREPAFMPSVETVAGLTTRPPDYAPAMVNFLQYKGKEGARAYQRYGRIAMRTVYRTGGELLFYGRIIGIQRAAIGGPCAGVWDDVAAMRYNRPDGILSMEHAPDYRAALHYRDAGLLRTIVIASTPEKTR